MATTFDPFGVLEAAVFEICPHLRHVEIIIRDLDLASDEGTTLRFHRDQVVALYMPVIVQTDEETGATRLLRQGDLPLGHIISRLAKDTSPPKEGELAVLALAAQVPGLRGKALASRLRCSAGSLRHRLANLVKRRGWLVNRKGYHVTDAGRQVLAASSA